MNDTSGLPQNLVAKTLAGLKWAYLSVAARLLLSLLLVAILARLLTPLEFGLFSMVMIVVGLAETVGKLAIGPAIVQRLDLTARHLQTGFTLALAIGFILAAVLWFLAFPIGTLFSEPMAPRLLRTLTVVLIVNSIGVMPEYMLRRNLRFKNLGVADVLSESVGYGLTSLVLASLGYGVWALVAGAILRRAVHVSVVLFHCSPAWRLRINIRAAKELLHYGSPLSLVSLFNSIAQRASYFIVGRWLGAQLLGYFTQSYRLVSVPLEAVSLTLLNVLFPAMSARQQHVDRLQSVYLHGVEMLALLAIPASGLLFVTAPRIVDIVLGRQWGAVVPLVQILAVALPFKIGGAMNVPTVRALGGVYREAWRQAIWALAVVVGTYLGSRWGLHGVAVSVAFSWLIIQMLMTQLALSLLGLGWLYILRSHLPGLWVGGWSLLAVWMASLQLREMSLSVAISLGLDCLIWFVAVIAAMYFCPRCFRPDSAGWIMAHLPFETLGRPGAHLRTGLATILRVAS